MLSASPVVPAFFSGVALEPMLPVQHVGFNNFELNMLKPHVVLRFQLFWC